MKWNFSDNKEDKMSLFAKTEFLHILRNPYGFTKEQVKQAQLDACEAYEDMREAYKNMSDFAVENGLNVTANAPRS